MIYNDGMNTFSFKRRREKDEHRLKLIPGLTMINSGKVRKIIHRQSLHNVSPWNQKHTTYLYCPNFKIYYFIL